MANVNAQPNPVTQRNRVDKLMAGDKVTMMFPKNVRLVLDNGDGIIDFHAGVQDVPVSIADHWWLADNGAKSYARPIVESATDLNKKAVNVSAPVFNDQHVGYLRSIGYKNIDTAEAVKVFFEKLPNSEQKSSFLLSAENYKERVSTNDQPQDKVKLDTLTKAQLAEHANNEHGVEIDPAKMNKDEMIAEVEKLREKK